MNKKILLTAVAVGLVVSISLAVTKSHRDDVWCIRAIAAGPGTCTGTMFATEEVGKFTHYGYKRVGTSCPNSCTVLVRLVAE